MRVAKDKNIANEFVQQEIKWMFRNVSCSTGTAKTWIPIKFFVTYMNLIDRTHKCDVYELLYMTLDLFYKGRIDII